jgi:hypothetical protein
MEVKEAPARGLRAVFAGFGRALGGRRKGATAPTATAEAGDSGHVKVLAPEEAATPETRAAETTAAETATAESVVVETVAVETVVVEAVTPEAEPQAVAAEAVVAETAAAETATPAEPGDALPLANYETLTVASLRARLRTLTVPQLRILIEYENAHQGRDEVTGMFERRIAKIVAGETTGFPAVK